MVDVTRMTYYELKRTALENVMRLEQIGRISKHNYYQDVLNAIASDIRTKSRTPRPEPTRARGRAPDARQPARKGQVPGAAAQEL